MFESHFNIKFYIELGKSSSETLGMLRTAYDEVAMEKPTVFEWHKKFKKDGKMWQSVESNSWNVRTPPKTL